MFSLAALIFSEKVSKEAECICVFAFQKEHVFDARDPLVSKTKTLSPKRFQLEPTIFTKT